MKYGGSEHSQAGQVSPVTNIDGDSQPYNHNPETSTLEEQNSLGDIGR